MTQLWIPPPPPPPPGYAVGLFGMTDFGKTTALESWRRGALTRTMLYTPHPYVQPGQVVTVDQLMGPELWAEAAKAKPTSVAWIVPHRGDLPKDVGSGLIALLKGIERSGLTWFVGVEEAGVPGRDLRLGVIAGRVRHFAASTLVLSLQRWKGLEPGTRDNLRRVYFFHYEDTEDLAEVKKRRPKLDVDALPTLGKGEFRWADSSGMHGRNVEFSTSTNALVLRRGQ